MIHRPLRAVAAPLPLFLLTVTVAFAAPAPAARPAPAAHPAAAAAVALPRYEEPAAYSVDLVIQSPKAKMVLKRFIDHGRVRTEITGADEDLVLIELGDEKGTTLTLMPKEKRAMRQSRAAMASLLPERARKDMREGDAAAAAPAPEGRFEDLGEETLGGRAVKKVRMTMPQGTSVGWFDKTTGAPVRMEGTVEGETTVVEWKDYQVAPQPAKLFESPKDYELTDMDEMMGKMKGMGAMGSMGSMMGGMGQGMGQSMGSSLGASLGGALGGPVGAMAGQYLGGKVGGAIGRKAGTMVTPGK